MIFFPRVLYIRLAGFGSTIREEFFIVRFNIRDSIVIVIRTEILIPRRCLERWSWW